jgi:two-component system, sensor histidine kinase YesM
MLVFLMTTIIIFGVNIYMYFNMNYMIGRIDNVYLSNTKLNDLQNSLTGIQTMMTEYLSTKSTDSAESYYEYESTYRNLLKDLNLTSTDNESLLMEKNIYHISTDYLDFAEKAIQAKRGRNVEKYKLFYDEASKLYNYVDTYIYSLNNQQFQNNSSNYEILFASLKNSEAITMLVLLMVALLNIVLILILTRGITEPLKRLSTAANQVALGRLSIEQLEVKNHDEVGVVTNAFNQMVNSLNDYITQIRNSMELEREMKERELLMESHLKDAQLKYLQAQINPHFLFNTLNAGAQLAMLEGAEKTYAYVQNVADFFRYNVKKNSGSVTLAQEIELVDNYIYILNVRFSGDIHFEKQIDHNLTNIQVPSMILQPIVENAIHYGIRGMEGKGIIRMEVIQEDDQVCISIRDNGVGMSQEKIAEIMKGEIKESSVNNDSNGIGIGNVISRLRLFFHQDNVMEITSLGESMGTEVAIFIPLEGKEKHHV